MVLRLADLGDELDFDASPEWNLRDTEGATRVRAFLAENFDEELGGPIGHEMLLCKRGRAVHQDKQFYDAGDLVEVPESGMQRCQELNGNATRCFFTFRDKEVFPKLTGPGLAFRLGDVTGNEEEVAGTNNRDESRHRRLSHGKSNVQSFKTVVDGHRGS